MIHLENISKVFKVATRKASTKDVLKSFFKKEYKEVRALDNISLDIKEGEIVGYIGPNGAGKSTTIKIMCGILVPTSGECIINGKVPYKQRKEYVKDIGVVFGQRSQLWWDVPPDDSFYLLKDIYKIPTKEFEETRQKLINALDLSQIIHVPTRQLSLGQRMRCEIAASLLHRPKILFLDEPTIGLDAVSKIAVRRFIKELNHNEGTTVILTTHDMQDIEALTNRVILIGKGKKLYDGSLDEIRKRYSSKFVMSVQYEYTNNKININDVEVIEQNEQRAILSFNSNIIKLQDVISLLTKQVNVLDVQVESSPIEEVIAKMYEEMHI